MPDADWWAKVARARPGGERAPEDEPDVEAVTDQELGEVESEARSFLEPDGRLAAGGSEVTESQRVIARVVFSIAGELRRLRSEEWIDLAADEIAGDPSSCTGAADRIADVIRSHMEGAMKR